MKRKLPLYMLLAAFVGAPLVSCNEDKDDEENETEEVQITSSLAVNSFSLSADKNVLANLDSVFFTIDLANAVVFNADSLPKDTKINKLVAQIGLPTVSEATLSFTGADGTTQSIDYLTNKNDTIDFSHNDVKLHLVDYTGRYSRDYAIKVNVHTMVADSLFWDKAAMRALPTSLSDAIEQHTVDANGTVLCFTRSASACCVASADDPAGNWTNSASNLPADALINSITASPDALFAVTTDGKLITSTDNGVNWTALPVHMNHILGAYGSTILGVRLGSDGVYYHTTYPASTEVAVDAGFPVAGTSQAVTYSNKWSTEPMLMLVGGATSSGALTGATWAYDGNIWGCISPDGIPAMEGVCLVPYYTYKINNQWVASEVSTLVAIGGRKTDGKINPYVYISLNRGLNWVKADQCMQLPLYLEPVAYAQSVVRSVVLTTRSAGNNGWRDMPVNGLPVWYRGSQSRASVAITSWDCPYVYLFGGETERSGLSAKVWRGVINRMTFKPLQ